VSAAIAPREVPTMDHAKRVVSIKRLITWLALAEVFLVTVMPATGQGRPIVLDGRVQWIAAGTMMVLPEAGGIPVNIDLTRVPQDHYAGLVQGNPVVVSGSYDGHRILATSVSPARDASR
jgi:hypothetical protein